MNEAASYFRVGSSVLAILSTISNENSTQRIELDAESLESIRERDLRILLGWTQKSW